MFNKSEDIKITETEEVSVSIEDTSETQAKTQAETEPDKQPDSETKAYLKGLVQDVVKACTISAFSVLISELIRTTARRHSDTSRELPYEEYQGY